MKTGYRSLGGYPENAYGSCSRRLVQTVCSVASRVPRLEIRRLAEKHAVPDVEKLADVITELKKRTLLQGPQIGIAQSYSNFRNQALHAKWNEIDRAAVHSVLLPRTQPRRPWRSKPHGSALSRFSLRLLAAFVFPVMRSILQVNSFAFCPNCPVPVDPQYLAFAHRFIQAFAGGVLAPV